MGDDVIKDFEEDDDSNSAIGDLVGDSAGRIPSVLATWIILFCATKLPSLRYHNWNNVTLFQCSF